ncbi:MAG: BatA domain-containing protein [Phycisphaerae bacterium]|nr:BatA domain-containing protein [Phycisphaerae bacterium]
MSFLVPIMALGIAAALIPLIIHLRNRSRYRVVHWGAMHLLESVVRTNRRRVRIEQVLLLIVRMAIPAAIALFMARPVLTGWEALPGDAMRSMVVVLDNSYSMEAGSGNQSSLAKAKRTTDAILAGLPRGSDAGVVPLAGGGHPVFAKSTVDLAGLRKRLADAPEGFARARPAAAIESAVGRFREMGHADRELVVVSDFQRVSWGEAETAELRRCAAGLRAMPVKPHVTLLRCGGEPVDNVSVGALSFSRLAIGVGQRTRMTATVRNDGRSARSGLRVHLKVDGRESETTEIAVGSGEQAQVMFSQVFETAGSHYVEVAVDPDAIMADNSMLASLRVWSRIPVLLINGEPSPEPLGGETDYLEIALQPFAGSGRLSDLVRARVLEPGQLDQKALVDTRVVVLANVATLSAEQTNLLEEFVRSGGGLLFFSGSKTDVGWFNAALAKAGDGLMPLRLRPPAGSQTDREMQTSVAADHFEHEAMVLFNNPENGTIAGAEVWMWLPPEDAGALKTAGDAMTVLARLANGDPLLIERRLGEGRVIFCATACDADWGNMPMRPAYVPLMQQLVTYLASTVYPPTNVESGGELVLFLPPEREGARAKVTLPDGGSQSMTATAHGPRAVVAFGPAWHPGLYVFSGEGIAATHFAVNAPREESDLRMLDERELAGVGTTLGADVAATFEEYATLQSHRRHGREVWRYLFVAVLALLAVEMLLEQWFARRAT